MSRYSTEYSISTSSYRVHSSFLCADDSQNYLSVGGVMRSASHTKQNAYFFLPAFQEKKNTKKNENKKEEEEEKWPAQYTYTSYVVRSHVCP